MLLFRPSPYRDDRGFFTRTFDAEVGGGVRARPSGVRPGLAVPLGARDAARTARSRRRGRGQAGPLRPRRDPRRDRRRPARFADVRAASGLPPRRRAVPDALRPPGLPARLPGAQRGRRHLLPHRPAPRPRRGSLRAVRRPGSRHRLAAAGGHPQPAGPVRGLVARPHLRTMSAADAHRCRGCRSTEGEVVLDLGDQPAADHFPLAADPGRTRATRWPCGGAPTAASPSSRTTPPRRTSHGRSSPARPSGRRTRPSTSCSAPVCSRRASSSSSRAPTAAPGARRCWRAASVRRRAPGRASSSTSTG